MSSVLIQAQDMMGSCLPKEIFNISSDELEVVRGPLGTCLQSHALLLPPTTD